MLPFLFPGPGTQHSQVLVVSGDIFGNFVSCEQIEAMIQSVLCLELRGGSAIIVIVNPPKGRKPEVRGSGSTIMESPNEMYKLSNVV